MKFLVSLLGLGVSGGGVFIGTLQQNLSNIKTEIDKLFEEIEQDIRDFSNKNPLTATQATQIKTGNSSATETQIRRKRNTATSEEEKKPEHTLGVWTDIWIKLLSGYIYKLWRGDSTTSSNENLESRVFSLEDKQKALDAAETNTKNEKEKFENELNSQKQKIKEIYQKMKKFLQIMKLPKKYNSSTHADTPYEEYVLEILKN